MNNSLFQPSLMEFFISKQWINKFNTFAEPGPICNDDFLCKHGGKVDNILYVMLDRHTAMSCHSVSVVMFCLIGVPPHKINHVDDLVISFNQSLWEFLYQRYRAFK